MRKSYIHFHSLIVDGDQEVSSFKGTKMHHKKHHKSSPYNLCAINLLKPYRWKSPLIEWGGKQLEDSIVLCWKKKKESYWFKKTWGYVNNYRIFLGRTNSLTFSRKTRFVRQRTGPERKGKTITIHFALPHLFLLFCLPGGSVPEGENGLPPVEKG